MALLNVSHFGAHLALKKLAAKYFMCGILAKISWQSYIHASRVGYCRTEALTDV